MDRNKELDIVHKEELRILENLLKIFQKYNIRNYMLGGTFLGAIRHKGFIPWDDDVDIGIPRPDYERFLKICREELNSDFKMITGEDEESKYNYFCKIESKKVRLYDDGCKIHKIYGAWIDIFPMDGMPNNKILRNLHKFNLLKHRAFWKLTENCGNVAIQSNHRSLLERIIIFFGVHFKVGKLFSKKKELLKINRMLQKYDYDSSVYNVNFMGAYKFKEMFKKELFDKTEEYQFEYLKLTGVLDYDFYLKQLYGNYMKEPEVEERNQHSTKLLNEKGE